MGTRTPDSAVGAVLRFNVNRLLAERGWEASRLYRDCGLTRGQYSRIYKSPDGPRLAAVFALADALGVPPDQLLKTRRRVSVGG